VGFTVNEITIVDKTNGGSFYWNSGMATASILDVDSGVVTTTNGVTPLSQSAAFGATVSNFTSANPGVITVNDTATFGFAAGDTVMTSAIAEAASGTTKNGEFTVASVTATAITLVENTTGYATYVSGGYVTRVSDTNGDPIATQNFAIQGVTLGTSAVGANSALMCATLKGANPVL